MFIYTFQTIFISLILIILIHYLYNFFKDTLTIPKTKDLVNSSQYQEIIDIINNKDYIRETNLNKNNSTPIDNLQSINPSINKEEMKDELKNFLKQINNESTVDNDSTPLENNPFTSTNTFSNFM